MRWGAIALSLLPLAAVAAEPTNAPLSPQISIERMVSRDAGAMGEAIKLLLQMPDLLEENRRLQQDKIDLQKLLDDERKGHEPKGHEPNPP